MSDRLCEFEPVVVRVELKNDSSAFYVCFHLNIYNPIHHKIQISMNMPSKVPPGRDNFQKTSRLSPKCTNMLRSNDKKSRGWNV